MDANRNDELLWGYLVHLSFNMWADREVPEREDAYLSAKPYLRFDESLWRDLVQRMVEVGINAVVLDLGDGVRYESHPEIAVEGAWSVGRLRAELARLRELGLEPIPKLNFSTCHDAWLGPYARCVSSDDYYRVCRDLIAEVCALFDGPRFFHLGMDEETARHQRHHAYVVIRQYDLWWHDLLYMVELVEQAGVRPWIWSDYVWDHAEMFWERMPRSVLQSNWYYGAAFDEEIGYVQAYRGLEEHGYDQVPTGSNWSAPENLPGTVAYCTKHVAPERLKGFLQTVWKPTLDACRAQHMEALDVVQRAKI